VPSAFRGVTAVLYTGWIMTAHREQNGRITWSVQGGKALMCSRVALSEVQIDGIPKPSMSEVASTA
jgi:hypothetical protein